MSRIVGDKVHPVGWQFYDQILDLLLDLNGGRKSEVDKILS